MLKRVPSFKSFVNADQYKLSVSRVVTYGESASAELTSLAVLWLSEVPQARSYCLLQPAYRGNKKVEKPNAGVDN